MQVAGAFTLEGFGAAWIDSIDGNYGTITGLSIPVLRRLLRQLGVELVGLWTSQGRPDLAGDHLTSDLSAGQPGPGPSDPLPRSEDPPGHPASNHPSVRHPESEPPGG